MAWKTLFGKEESTQGDNPLLVTSANELCKFANIAAGHGLFAIDCVMATRVGWLSGHGSL